MNILMIDNFDSFTYNLVHYIEKLNARVDVIRNDVVDPENIHTYDKIIISPGPGLPSETKILKKIILKFYKTKPILGVCLGLQAIVESFGGKIMNLQEVVHGFQKKTIITDTKEILFKGVPAEFLSGRYHSWVADPTTIPVNFLITATDQDQHIMAISHKKYPLKGIQFHPESIMTPQGEKIIQNWLYLI